MVLEEHNVGHESHPGIRPLDKVVREDAVLGEPLAEGRSEGLEVVEPLADERGLLEEVLVHVRDRACVWIDPRLSAEDPDVPRPGRAGQGQADPGLQHAVACHHPPNGRVDHGPVERVGSRADQLPGLVAGQLGVCVEGDDVPCPLESRDVTDDHAERIGVARDQQPVQGLDRAPLPFVAHEPTLPRIPQSGTVQE